MGHEKSGIPLTQELLDKARMFWARSGRNSVRTAEEFGCCAETIRKYVVDLQWDKWAVELDERTAEEDLVRAAREHGKAAAAIGMDKVKQGVKEARTRGVGLGELASSLDKFTKVHQLLTGGATDRLAVDGFWDGWAKKSDDEKREFLAELRRRITGPDSADSDSGSED